MRPGRRVWQRGGALLAAAVAAVAATPVAAADDRGAVVAREIAELRADIAAYRRGDDQWLDAERAASIRAMVHEVLDDASSRTMLQPSQLTAGYDGKAFIASADGAFVLRIHGFVQTRHTINHRDSAASGDDAWTKGFETRRVRLFFTGSAGSFGYRFRASTGSDGTLRLDQGYIDVPLADTGFTIRAGQLHLPLFRDDYVDADGQLLVDTSVVNQLFNPGNSTGVQLRRAWDRFRFWLAYSNGLRSANRAWNDPANAEHAVTARAELRGGAGEWPRFDSYTSFPGDGLGWMVGVGGHWSGGAQQVDAEAVKLAYFTLDGTIEGDGWNVSAMGVLAYDNLELTDGRAIDAGLLVQGGVFVAPSVELFSRFEIVLPSDDRPGANDSFLGIAAGFNWYIAPRGQRLKLTMNVLYFPEPTEGTAVDALGGGRFPNQGVLPTTSGNQAAVQTQLQFQF